MGVKIKNVRRLKRCQKSTRWVSKMLKPMGIPKFPKYIYGLKNAKMFDEASQNSKNAWRWFKIFQKCLTLHDFKFYSTRKFLPFLLSGVIILQVYNLVLPLWQLTWVKIECHWIFFFAIRKKLKKCCHFLIKMTFLFKSTFSKMSFISIEMSEKSDSKNCIS